MFKHKLSQPYLLILVICLVVLATTYLFSINSRDNNGKIAAQKIDENTATIATLNSSKDYLYLAENAYQQYLAAAQPVYRDSFLMYLESFVAAIDKTGVLNNSGSDKLSIDIQQRVALSQAIVQLKQVADELLTSALQDSVFGGSGYVTISSKQTDRLIKSYFSNTNDTIKFLPIKEKKTLFKKITSIFKEEKDSIAAINSSATQTATTSDSTSTISLNQQQKQRQANRSLQIYFKNLLQKELLVRKEIDQKTKQSALLNQTIFNNLQHEIAGITQSLNQQQLQDSKLSISQYQQANKYQHNLFTIALVIISILILLLGYKISSTRKYEKSILSDKQQAVALSEMKSSFLNTMSHEIRTPLTAVIGFADYIQTKGIDENTIDYIRNIKYASDHLLETVNDVLEFSKIESGNIELVEEVFSIHELIQNTINTLKLQAEKKQITLTLDSSIPKDATLKGDAFHIRQIIYNLINNAIKFTDKGGVTFKASLQQVEGNKVHFNFQVIDTGKGISKEAIDEVFKEFVQIRDAQKKTNKQTMGSGLGLAITKKLITFLGGAIQLTSKLGKGSTFTVSIPMTKVAPQKVLSDTTKTTINNSMFAGKSVLLAEDSEPIIMLTLAILKEMKLEVDVAKNGEEAYNKYQQNKAAYDFILTDIEMPILNGHDMAAKIRTTNKDICIIAMTAHTAPEAYEQYKEYGINTVITKPFKKEDIIRVFAECSMAALNSKTKKEENYYLSNNN